MKPDINQHAVKLLDPLARIWLIAGLKGYTVHDVELTRVNDKTYVQMTMRDASDTLWSFWKPRDPAEVERLVWRLPRGDAPLSIWQWALWQLRGHLSAP